MYFTFGIEDRIQSIWKTTLENKTNIGEDI